MLQAIKLAARAIGTTMPNPPVGALVVSKGAIVGEGYHKRAGGPHAEVFALKSAGSRARGAILYVTLEPCSTHGRTGPCTQAIIQSGIRTVVVAIRDPNPVHNGRGIATLKKAGITVIEGICRQQAGELIKPFSKWIITGKPFLTLKLGISLDGKIADIDGRSKWITSKTSRRLVMNLRRKVDAILVGAGTARTDNPSLLCARERKPFRVIVDSYGSLSLDAKVLNDAYVERTIIATTEKCSKRRHLLYEKKGAQVWRLPANKTGYVSLSSVISRLGKNGILHVLCEGGGEIASGLIRQNLVDEYLIFIAPLIIGGRRSVPSVGGKGWPLYSCPRLKFTACSRSGPDIQLHAVSDVRLNRGV